MKLGLILAGAALALMGANAAQAQISISLSSPTTISLPGGGTALVYGGSFTNTGTTSLDIIGTTFAQTSNIQFFDALQGQYADGTNDPNISSLPFTLTPGGNYSDPDLFELIAPNASAAELRTAVASYGVITAPTQTAVPEPGSVALLASGLVGGGLFVARRRRK